MAAPTIPPPPVLSVQFVTQVRTLSIAAYDFLTKLWKASARSGRHTVTAAEVLAGAASFSTGPNDGLSQNVQIFRAGNVSTADVTVALSAAGTMSVSSGTAYVLTAGDVVAWQVFGQ